MLSLNQSLYVGKDNENGYLGYVAEKNFFLIISVEEGMTKEQGKCFLEDLKSKFLKLSNITLSHFESEISSAIVRGNVPLNFSLAAGYIHDTILYLKTIGEGEIYVRRGKSFAKLISGDNRASGYLKEYDCFIFTTAKIVDLLKNEDEIKKIVGYKTSQDIVNDLYAQEFQEEDKGFIALVIEMVQQKEATAGEGDFFISNPESEEIPPSSFQPKSSRLSQLKNPLAVLHLQGNKKKIVTLIGVAIILAILIWSVLLGNQRRMEAQAQKKIAASRELIDQKLSKAEEESLLNIEAAQTLISEAKAETAKLKKEVENSKAEEISNIEKLIAEKENLIVKKEEKKYEEFYDLTLENKDAQGVDMYLDGEKVAILDKKNGSVYLLSLLKKSLEKKTAKELTNATFVTLDEDKVYFFQPSKGVFLFTDETKVKQIIKNDDEWGKIIDASMYNGNLYLLDNENDEIYKYVPVEGGFSEKSSYFQSGQSIALQEATSLTIDSSVYISLADSVAKYTTGSRETFNTSFPANDVSLTKVHTSADVEKLFAWDKKKGTIYILNKDGNFERQIQSGILTKGDDFVVYENAVYVLVGQKIYKIDL